MTMTTTRKRGLLDWIGSELGTYCNRTWVIDSNTVATLEHDCMIGRRIFMINGEVIYNQTVFPDRSFVITFTLNGKKGEVSVVNVHSELSIYYTMKFDGEDVVSTVFDVASTQSLEGAFEISIPEVKTEGKVTLYKVVAKKQGTGDGEEGNEMSRVVWRRFRDFVQLQHEVWSSFAGSHLLANVPTPPRRAWKLFTNHQDPNFIEGRRVGLELFLSKLMFVPRISTNVYIHRFFETDKNTAGASTFIGSACTDNVTLNMDAVVVLIGVAAPGKLPVCPKGSKYSPRARIGSYSSPIATESSGSPNPNPEQSKAQSSQSEQHRETSITETSAGDFV